MKTDITPEQAEAYRADGFLVVEDFLSPAEVNELGDAVDEAVALMGNRKISSGPDWRDGDGYYERVFKQRLNLWMINQVVKRYVLAPALGRMLCTLANIDGIRVWHDQALIKGPFGNPTAWHIDNPYWSFYSKASLSIWIALDDARAKTAVSISCPRARTSRGSKPLPSARAWTDSFASIRKWRSVMRSPRR